MADQILALADAKLRTLFDLLQEQIASGRVDPEIVARLRDAAGQIEQQAKKEVALRESEEHARRIIDSFLAMVGVMTPDGTLIEANANALGAAGLRREEVVGRKFWECYWWSYDVQEQDRLREAVAKAASGESVRYDAVVRMIHDSRMTIDFMLAPVRNGTGQITYLIPSAIDITERKKIETDLIAAKEAADEAARAKDTFLVNMSHELRTPLTVNMGMLALARMSGGCSEEALQYLDHASRSADALMQMIQNILELRSLQEKTLPLAAKPFDLVACCREVFGQLVPPAEYKGLHCTVDLDPRLPRQVIGDADKVQEILFHLIGNAVKFTEEGKIVISVRPSDGRETILFEIRDTGIGIPAAMLQSIFQPFSQADPSLTRRYGGAGLGLAISRELIGQLGGKLEVRSEPGTGSLFSFRLPFKTVEEETEKTSADGRQPMESRPAGRSARILVVEDVLQVAKLIQRILTQVGYLVQLAEHGRQALEILEKEPIDLILMDLKMPVMDGYEATRSIRQREEWRQIPIVALTAHARSEDEAQCLAVGMNDFLTKPVDIDKLYATIETHLFSGP